MPKGAMVVFQPLLFDPYEPELTKKNHVGINSWDTIQPYIDAGCEDWVITMDWATLEGHYDKRLINQYVKWLPGRVHLKIHDALPLSVFKKYDIDTKNLERKGNGIAFKHWHNCFIDDFLSFVRNLVSDFGNKLYSIENGIESSVYHLWQEGGHSVDSFTIDIAKPTYREIKKRNKNVVVIGFNDTMQGDDINKISRKESWEQAITNWINCGGLESCDVVGVHLYYSVINRLYGWDRLLDETLTVLKNATVSSVAKEKIRKGLWITETGYRSKVEHWFLGLHWDIFKYKKENQSRQMFYWFKELYKIHKTPSVLGYFIYCHWMHDGSEDDFSLLMPSGEKKSAFKTVQSFWKRGEDVGR